MKALIQELVEAYGPSGSEKEIRELVRNQIAPHVEDMQVDALGNLIAHKGPEDGPKVMLAAHMDEIGVIATHVDENGFVRFTSVGVVYPRNCVGSRVRFMNGARGVIGAERLEGMDKVPGLDQLYIDLGAQSREDCPVQVGDVGGFERPFLDLGKRLVAKSMDDRIGVAVLVETLRQLKSTPNRLSFVFSVQEEVGMRGATTATYGVEPDVGIAVDVCPTGDTPKGIAMEVSLGKGPGIKVRDKGMLSDPRVVDWMVAGAKKAGLPYQLEVLEQGTTDAYAIQLSRAGVPASCLSIPCRYVHSPSEMVDYDDVQNGVKLLVELLANPVKL